MDYTENTLKTFSAGSFLPRPANFSVLSNDRKRPALIFLLPVRSSAVPFLHFSCHSIFVFMRNNPTDLPVAASQAYDQLSEFFDQYNLPESKTMLWKFFTATVTGHYEQLSVIEKENIVTFYERLNGLLDSIHTLKPVPQQNQ